MRPKDSLVPTVADMKIKDQIPKHFQKKPLAIEVKVEENTKKCQLLFVPNSLVLSFSYSYRKSRCFVSFMIKQLNYNKIPKTRDYFT